MALETALIEVVGGAAGVPQQHFASQSMRPGAPCNERCACPVTALNGPEMTRCGLGLLMLRWPELKAKNARRQ
jgi:hypothetical protein